jgi:hypothetical protein
LFVLLPSNGGRPPPDQATHQLPRQFGVHSAHGPLLSSGLLRGGNAGLKGTTTGAAAAAAGAAPGQGRTGGAVSVHLLKHPQDGSADYSVKLAVAPSYVTYNRVAISEVADFFKSDRPMELSRLQAQAAARTDKLRHMAQLQIKAMSARNAKEKPRLLLGVTMHAPKIAIPDEWGSTTLIADLGCFTLESNPDLLATLGPEEAALYECFSVSQAWGCWFRFGWDGLGWVDWLSWLKLPPHRLQS